MIETMHIIESCYPLEKMEARRATLGIEINHLNISIGLRG